jgi:hypothetical protein
MYYVYCGDLNTRHSNIRTIRLPEKSMAANQKGCPVFECLKTKWPPNHLKNGQIGPVFKWFGSHFVFKAFENWARSIFTTSLDRFLQKKYLLMYKMVQLKPIQKLDNLSGIGMLCNQMPSSLKIDHLNSGLVRYLNPHCRRKIHCVYLQENKNKKIIINKKQTQSVFFKYSVSFLQ